MRDKAKPQGRICENRRARFDYHIEEDLVVGVVLRGAEVKSLRSGGSNIADSYAVVEGGELWLVNGYIAPLQQASAFGAIEPRARRKLLAHKREIAKLWNATQRKGMTIVPLDLFFDDRGCVKLKIGLARGKNAADKRAATAERDWGRDKQRLLKQAR